MANYLDSSRILVYQYIVPYILLEYEYIYMANKRVLWYIYFQVTWVLIHCIPVQDITVGKVQNYKFPLKVNLCRNGSVILSILSRYRYLTVTECEREGCLKWTWMLLNMSLIVTQLSRSRWVTVTGHNRKYYCSYRAKYCFLWADNLAYEPSLTGKKYIDFL